MHLCLYYNMMESDLQPQEPWKYMKNCEKIYMRIVRKFTPVSGFVSRFFEEDKPWNWKKRRRGRWGMEVRIWGKKWRLWYNELMHKNKTKEAVGAHFSAD